MRNTQICSLILVIVFFLAMVNNIAAQQLFQADFESLESKQKSKLMESFKSYKVFSLDFSQINKYVKERYADDNIILNMNIGNLYYWHLSLELNDMRAIGYKSVFTTDDGETEQQLQAVNTYKGFLNGNRNDIVRLTIEDNDINGYIIENLEMHYIEPLSNFIGDAKQNQLIMYSPNDVITKETSKCGVIEMENMQDNINNNLLEQYPEPCAGDELIEVEIATDADFEYYGVYGTNTNSHILGILSQVQGLYFINFKMKFLVTFQHVYTTANNPFTSSNANTLLNQFRNHWNTNMTNVNRDIAHLWTGKNLDGDPVGLAWVGVVCLLPNLSYSLSQNHNDDLGAVKITAHEIGHNFNAVHADGVNCGVVGSVMCPTVELNSYYFSAATVNTITNFINANPECYDCFHCPECFDCPPNANITFTIPSFFNITFEVSNSITASNIIESGAVVTYDAGNQIVLQPGFHAKAGSHFHAVIDGCSVVNFKKGNSENNDYDTTAISSLVPYDEPETNNIEATTGISIYPNPTPGEFRLTTGIPIAIGSQEATVRIHDLLGNLIYSSELQGQSSETIDISSHGKGVYLVRVVQGSRVFTEKLIHQ